MKTMIVLDDPFYSSHCGNRSHLNSVRGTMMPIPSLVIRQAGAIPIQGGQVCIVSSRSGKRWVVPKGWLEPGKTAGGIALLEAWEEAGVTGALRPEPAGSYLYGKDARTNGTSGAIIDNLGLCVSPMVGGRWGMFTY